MLNWTDRCLLTFFMFYYMFVFLYCVKIKLCTMYKSNRVVLQCMYTNMTYLIFRHSTVKMAVMDMLKHYQIVFSLSFDKRTECYYPHLQSPVFLELYGKCIHILAVWPTPLLFWFTFTYLKCFSPWWAAVFSEKALKSYYFPRNKQQTKIVTIWMCDVLCFGVSHIRSGRIAHFDSLLMICIYVTNST